MNSSVAYTLTHFTTHGHTMLKRIGFAAKWIDTLDQIDGIKPKDTAKQYNTGTTTVAWLNRQPRHRAEEKLWDLMKANIESIRKLVLKVPNSTESQNGQTVFRNSASLY